MKKMLTLAAFLLASAASAQTPAHDPSDKLATVLPDGVRERVLQTIADARAVQLPAQALEHRALELAAKGATADEIERKVTAQAKAMADTKRALNDGGDAQPSDDEIEAGADVMGKGVDAKVVSALARTAPKDRDISVPLLVIGQLVDRGLPSDEALAAVQARLSGTDAELRQLPEQAQAHKPAVTGRDLSTTKRPTTGGRPAGVPANPGTGAAAAGAGGPGRGRP